MNLTNPVFTKNADQTSYHVTHPCVSCGHVTKGEIQASDLFQWRQGMAPQHAFPYLSSAQSEALFMSGICGFCWDNLYGHDDDEEEEDYEDTYTSGEQYYADYINSDSYIAYLNG